MSRKAIFAFVMAGGAVGIAFASGDFGNLLFIANGAGCALFSQWLSNRP